MDACPYMHVDDSFIRERQQKGAVDVTVATKFAALPWRFGRGSVLSALKKWDCWVAWLLVNITQLALHISVGHVFMPIICGLYLINGIASLFSWMKLYRKNA